MNNNEEKLPPYSSNKQREKNPYLPFVLAMVLASGVLIGYLVNTLTLNKHMTTNGRYDKLNDIINYVTDKYVDTINRNQLVDKTIDKMLSTLDPHSVYIPAKDVSEMNEQLEGNFEGIGIEFYIVQDTITVVSAISGGPSEQVGLRAGDRIVKIDDTLVCGTSKIKENEVKHHLRGQKGTKVKVTIMRSGIGKLLDFNIIRDKIPLYSIDAAYMVNDHVGYIRISSFSAGTHEEFVEKMGDLQDKGMKKLIIDLRGNPGGYLQAATEIADELIAGDKLLVYTKGQAYGRQDYKAEKQGMFETGDLAVLIDQGSASASEILSGAIQDWDRGTIIGRTSFGKGLVQEQKELKDHSSIRLTVARYYTPSGRCIQRSYDKGSEAYYDEIYERYMKGEFVKEDSIASKDTTVYKTANGRRMYGGGGIRPDIFVPIDTVKGLDYFYTVRSFVPEFVYKYSGQHSDMMSKYKTVESFKRDFTVSDDLMKEFYAFAISVGLKAEPAKEKPIEAKVKLNLKAFFAKEVWRMDGFYYVINDQDKVMEKAVETLK